jgi:hypothetical protein
MEEVLNGYVTNPNPTPTLTSTLTLTLTELIKKSKKKRLYKIDRAVCWMEKSANLTNHDWMAWRLENSGIFKTVKHSDHWIMARWPAEQWDFQCLTKYCNFITLSNNS